MCIRDRSKALYGDQFNAAQVNQYYMNLFGRPAEPAGIQYWLGQVALGIVTPAGAAIAILNGARNNDIVVVQNKLVAAASFTTGLDTTDEIVGYTGDTAAASARAFLATVTNTPATQAQIDAAIDAATNNTPPVDAGTTFIPVSYTHLDVYKRQAYVSGPPSDPYKQRQILFADVPLWLL